MKKRFIYLYLIGIFLFSQVVFINHQLDHAEEAGHHPDLCFVCVLDIPTVWNVSQNTIQYPDFDDTSLLKKSSFIFKKNLYSQSLPRSPPLKQIFNSVWI